MNRVLLIGNLTKDPETRYQANSQNAVCTFTVALNRGKDKDGKDKGADFPRITVFGKTAENCDRYLKKGRQVAIEGRIQTGSYKDKNGNTVYTTDVVADRVEFIGSNAKNNDSSEENGNNEQYNIPQGFCDIDEDIPF